jgi:hypothetical protein
MPCKRCLCYFQALQLGDFAVAQLAFEALPHRPRHDPLSRPFRDYSIEQRSGPVTRVLEVFADEGILGPWRLVRGARTVFYAFDDLFWNPYLIAPALDAQDERMLLKEFGITRAARSTVEEPQERRLPGHFSRRS